MVQVLVRGSECGYDAAGEAGEEEGEGLVEEEEEEGVRGKRRARGWWRKRRKRRTG